MPPAKEFKPLKVPYPDALAQCGKCGATFSIDLVDVITGITTIHKDPEDPRFVDTPCGGRVRLFQEVQYG